MAEHHRFGKRSLAALNTVHPALRSIIVAVLPASPFDLTVIRGHRTKEDQERAVRGGRSKVHWPHGKHNSYPSHAADVAPYVNGRIPWDEPAPFCFLAGMMFCEARVRGLRLRWGGNWDGDEALLTDQRFDDLPHFEILLDGGADR